MNFKLKIRFIIGMCIVSIDYLPRKEDARSDQQVNQAQGPIRRNLGLKSDEI